MTTRRSVLLSLAALSALAPVIGADPAAAQAAKAEELAVPGPLGDVWLGKDDAKVTIIEYASMTCPHCANFTKKSSRF